MLDETYRDMGRPEPLPIGAGRSSAVISVSSMSKSYGIPGIRLGWLMTADPALQELFLAAKEQMVIGNSLIDEEIAFQVMRRREHLLPGIRAGIDAHREIVSRWMAGEDALEWVAPAGGVVCFPRIRADAGVDVEAFYDILTRNHGTFVGPGHWFEQPRAHFRLGYGWPGTAELQDGLANISASLRPRRADAPPFRVRRVGCCPASSRRAGRSGRRPPPGRRGGPARPARRRRTRAPDRPPRRWTGGGPR